MRLEKTDFRCAFACRAGLLPVVAIVAAVMIMAEPVVAAEMGVKAAVIRSTGTMYLGKTIWPDLNTGWSNFGNVPVDIDYYSLGGYDLTLSQIQNTNADVLIISTAGILTYTESEVNAIIDYVEAGHGIIITYHSFGFYSSDQNRRLAPLVGLSESIVLGTGYFRNGIQYDVFDTNHPVFHGIDSNYITGVPYMACPSIDGQTWVLDGGNVVAEALAVSGTALGRGNIITNETNDYRGLYFAHYIEDKANGANLQDMQVFYNGLLWTANVPEPCTGLLVAIGLSAFLSRRRRC